MILQKARKSQEGSLVAEGQLLQNYEVVHNGRKADKRQAA